MPKQHKSTEEKIAEINEILEPLNGEPLHIIPCLFFNEKTKHIFPYRIKFLLPQLCGYSDAQQSTVCISYISGRNFHFTTKTASAKKSFTQILQELDYRPIDQLLKPVENNLLPQATDKVLCPVGRIGNYSDNYYDPKSAFVLNRYTGYYSLLHATYKSAIQKEFKRPTDYLRFDDADVSAISDILPQQSIRTVPETVQRKVMLDKLTYGYVFRHTPIGHYKHRGGYIWDEFVQYGAAMELDSHNAPPPIPVTSVMDRMVALLTFGAIDSRPKEDINSYLSDEQYE
jgi:hypothetical protein